MKPQSSAVDARLLLVAQANTLAPTSIDKTMEGIDPELLMTQESMRKSRTELKKPQRI